VANRLQTHYLRLASAFIAPGEGSPIMPILDLPDPEKGLEVFEDLYGPEQGRRRFRTALKVLVPLGVVAAILILLAQITGSGKAIYSDVRGWFFPPSVSAPAVPPVSGDCMISNSNVYGHTEQHCSK
jgi:hypothetical protein